MRAQWRDRLKGTILAAAVLALMGVVVMGMMDLILFCARSTWMVVIGLVYYIGAIWKEAWNHSVVIMQRNLYIRVVVSRMDTVGT